MEPSCISTNVIRIFSSVYRCSSKCDGVIPTKPLLEKTQTLPVSSRTVKDDNCVSERDSTLITVPMISFSTAEHPLKNARITTINETITNTGFTVLNIKSMTFRATLGLPLNQSCLFLQKVRTEIIRQ